MVELDKVFSFFGRITEISEKVPPDKGCKHGPPPNKSCPPTLGGKEILLGGIIGGQEVFETFQNLFIGGHYWGALAIMKKHGRNYWGALLGGKSFLCPKLWGGVGHKRNPCYEVYLCN